MKILSKQKNSRMCMICGLDNEYGVNAPFYNMEDGSVMTVFRYKEQHQSYPGRVHGGMITAMLDTAPVKTIDYNRPAHANKSRQFRNLAMSG